MRKIFALVLISTVLLHANLSAQIRQPPSWAWARSGGGAADNDFARGAAADSNGAIFVTGDFRGAATIGGQTVNSVGGSGDYYAVKYNENGTVAWVRTYGGASGDVGVDLDTDGADNAVTTGTFGATVDFGSGNVLSSSGQRDIFVHKIATDGTTVWARKFGGAGNDSGNEIVTAANGDVVATGTFVGASITFPDGATRPKIGGGSDVWLAKFAADGNYQTGLTVGGSGDEQGRGVSVDSAGNILLCGQFTQNLSLNPAFVSAGAEDAYIAKFDANNNLLWTKHWGGAGEDAARGIDPAPDGSIFVAGKFTGTVNFDGQILNGANGDLFVAKLAADGTLVWIRQIGGASSLSEEGAEIEADNFGNLYVAGNFAATANFPNGIQLNSIGARDNFVAKFDRNGNALWATSGGGAADDINFAIALDTFGRVTIVGYFTGNATFGSQAIPGFGNLDFYIAHLNADSAELSGRITTAEGYSKRFVTVNLTNSGGTITRAAKTNAKGFYRFSDLPTGETYTVTPSFYTVNFTPANQTFLFTGGRTNVNFIFRRE